MPHINIAMYAGRSDDEKRALSERVTDAVMDTLGYGAEAVSVGIEDIAPSEWMEEIYTPRIAGHADRLFKYPGYGPLADRTTNQGDTE